MQRAIEETLGFVWIKQTGESEIKVAVHRPWLEAIGWMKTSFRCSQDSRMKRMSKIVRDERQRDSKPMNRWPCHGSLEIACDTFSTRPRCLVRLKHQMQHPPRGTPATPQPIIDFIKKYWVPSSNEQLLDIYKAIEQGRLQAPVECLKPKIVHYWWSQSMLERVRKDADPWVSMEMYLQQQPNVNNPPIVTIIILNICLGTCMRSYLGRAQGSNVVHE